MSKSYVVDLLNRILAWLGNFAVHVLWKEKKKAVQFNSIWIMHCICVKYWPLQQSGSDIYSVHQIYVYVEMHELFKAYMRLTGSDSVLVNPSLLLTHRPVLPHSAVFLAVLGIATLIKKQFLLHSVGLRHCEWQAISPLLVCVWVA